MPTQKELPKIMGFTMREREEGGRMTERLRVDKRERFGSIRSNERERERERESNKKQRYTWQVLCEIERSNKIFYFLINGKMDDTLTMWVIWHLLKV